MIIIRLSLIKKGVNGGLGSRECWQTYLASWDLTPKLNASKITIIKVKTIIIINTKNS